MAKNLLVDTGFWYALYDVRDTYHQEASILAEFLDQWNLILPWPCLYETLNTRFVKRRDWLDGFRAYCVHGNTVRLSDEPYRDDALAGPGSTGRPPVRAVGAGFTPARDWPSRIETWMPVTNF